MKKLIIFIVSIVGLCACQGQVFDPKESQMANVNFLVECSRVETFTRALDYQAESVVKDLNIYLFHKDVDVAKHLYIESEINLFSANLVKGGYYMFVIANKGSDLGELTIDGVRNLKSTIASQADIESKGLLMATHQSVFIESQTTIPVVLTRRVAKVEFNLSIAEKFAPHFTLLSVQVRNAPSGVTLFGSSASESVFDYDALTAAHHFYMFENAQGVNSSIFDQRQKTKANAPAKATYIHIQGYSEGKKVEYAIYLGENNTTDFNIYGNKHYIVNAIISGINEIDNRVSTSELIVTNFADKYKPDETAKGSLMLTSKNNVDNSFTLSYQVIQGDGSLLIDGVPYSQNSQIPFLSAGEQSKRATITYTQSDPSPVRIALTATDSYGFELTKYFTTSYIETPIVNVTIRWVNIIQNFYAEVWVEASTNLKSDIEVKYTVPTDYRDTKGNYSRGQTFSYTSTISKGEAFSNRQKVSITPNDKFVGLRVSTLQRPQISLITKASDDMNIYNIVNP